jgi:hypothetical protein
MLCQTFTALQHELFNRCCASRSLNCIFLSLWLVAGQLTATEAQTDLRTGLLADGQLSKDAQSVAIDVDGNELAVRLKSAPLDEVLKEIGRRASFGVTLRGTVWNNVSMEFQGVSLEAGLHKLLQGYGLVLVYAGSDSSKNATLEKIIVVSGKGEGSGNSVPTHNERIQALARTVAAKLHSDEIKTALKDHLYAPEARVRRDAFRDLIRATEVEDFDILIDLLQDEEVGMSAWNEVLAPLSDVMGWREKVYLQITLRKQQEREKFAEVLQSHRAFKLTDEAEFLQCISSDAASC